MTTKPPNPDDVLAYWRWYCEVIMWPAAPRAFSEFWSLVQSCELLGLLCDPGVYKAKWQHALIYHLVSTWEKFGHRGGWSGQVVQRTGQKGRPRLVRTAEPFEDLELSLCVLDSVVIGLLPHSDGKGRPSRHWKVSTDLLQHFFPEAPWTSSRFKTRWDRTNLHGRVNKYLREHRNLAREGLLRVGERSTYLTSDKYLRLIKAHLGARPSP